MGTNTELTLDYLTPLREPWETLNSTAYCVIGMQSTGGCLTRRLFDLKHCDSYRLREREARKHGCGWRSKYFRQLGGGKTSTLREIFCPSMFV